MNPVTPQQIDSESAVDFLIIGGGLSGLAAGIRLSQFGGKVRILESHTIPGGLNSWFPGADGTIWDTGLHALTNFVPAANREAPLNRIFRQLRIRRDDLELCPQSHSIIHFPNRQVVLDNDFPHLQQQLFQLFPEQQPALEAFFQTIEQSGYATAADQRTARQVMAQCGLQRDAQDMLALPVMYYGNPGPEDMPFADFAVMFKSVLQEGFARPKQGMKALLQLLTRRFAENGGELLTNRRVTGLECTPDGQQVLAAIDHRGQRHAAKYVISTIGTAETAALLSAPPADLASARISEMGFLEALLRLPKPAAQSGFSACIAFVNTTQRFEFRPPCSLEAPIESMLVCAPSNYCGMEADSYLRLSVITAPEFWIGIPQEEYQSRKERAAQRMIEALAQWNPALAQGAQCIDLFTPRTFLRFTGHRNGAIYGSPDKNRGFATSLKNLDIAGTDQGLLGIVGAMLSGILAANRRLA